MYSSDRLDLLENSQIYNGIINGGLDFWRSTTPISAVSQYLADRFRTSANTPYNSKYLMSQSSDIPSGVDVAHSIKIESTDTYTTQDIFGLVAQSFEGNFFKRFIGKNVTYSFYVKANHVAKYSMVMGNWAIDTYRKHELFDVDTTWKRVSVTFDIPDNVSYQEGTDPSFFVDLDLTVAPTSIAEGEYIGAGNISRGTLGQDNLFDTVGNEIYFTGFMLYETPLNTELVVPFKRMGIDFQEEEQLCQRYCEVIPAGDVMFKVEGTNQALYACGYSWKTVKRTTPTVNAFSISNINGGAGPYNTGSPSLSTHSFRSVWASNSPNFDYNFRNDQILYVDADF